MEEQGGEEKMSDSPRDNNILLHGDDLAARGVGQVLERSIVHTCKQIMLTSRGSIKQHVGDVTGQSVRCLHVLVGDCPPPPSPQEQVTEVCLISGCCIPW